jgi:hypothetical protein
MSALMAMFEKGYFRERASLAKGLEAWSEGAARMGLRWIPGDPRINPARRGGGREASRGWKGMRPE